MPGAFATLQLDADLRWHEVECVWSLRPGQYRTAWWESLFLEVDIPHVETAPQVAWTTNSPSPGLIQ